MKIIGITLVKHNIVVELDTKIPDSVDSNLYLYIDTLNNYTNRSSVNPDKHSYKVLVLGTDYSSEVQIDNQRLSIVIDSTKLENFCMSAFIATIDNSSQFFLIKLIYTIKRQNYYVKAVVLVWMISKWIEWYYFY